MSACSFHSASIRHSSHPVGRLRCTKSAVVISVVMTKMHGHLHQLPISVLCPYTPLRSHSPLSLMLLLCSSSLFILFLLLLRLPLPSSPYSSCSSILCASPTPPNSVDQVDLRHTNIELLPGKDNVIYRTVPIDQKYQTTALCRKPPMFPFPCLNLSTAPFTSTTLHSPGESWADIRSSWPAWHIRSHSRRRSILRFHMVRERRDSCSYTSNQQLVQIEQKEE